MVNENKTLLFAVLQNKNSKIKYIFMIKIIEIFVIKLMQARAVLDKKLNIFIFFFVNFNS